MERGGNLLCQSRTIFLNKVEEALHKATSLTSNSSILIPLDMIQTVSCLIISSKACRSFELLLSLGDIGKEWLKIIFLRGTIVLEAVVDCLLPERLRVVM